MSRKKQPQGWDAINEASTVARAAEADREEAARINAIFAAAFQTPAGKEALKILKARLGDRPSYIEGMTFDQTAFREGQKAVLREIEAMIKLHQNRGK